MIDPEIWVYNPDGDRRSNSRNLEHMTFDGAHLADFAVFAPAVTRSRFTGAGFHYGRA